MKRLFKVTAIVSLLLLLLISCGNNVEKSILYLDKGIDYHYKSQYEEAIEQFNKAIKYNENNHEAYYYRGCAKYNIFQKDDAVNDFLKTIEINPDYLQAYFNLGLHYRNINDYDMACYYFKIAEDKGRPNMEDYTKHCR